MVTPQPDPLAFGGNPDPGGNPLPLSTAPKTIPKRPLKKIWTAADGGPGPARWRKHKGSSLSFASPPSCFLHPRKWLGVEKLIYVPGNVRGLARRKGETNPMKYGFDVDDSIQAHPKMANSQPLPSRNTPKESKLKKKKAKGPKKALKERLRLRGDKKCEVM